MIRLRVVVAALLAMIASASFTSYAMAAASPDVVAPSRGHKIDLNSATQAELMELPGVGEVTANKIIANRPYKSTQDLSKAGVSGNEIAKIAGLVTVKSGSSRTATRTAPAGAASSNGATAAAHKIDLNSASEEQLQELPGVGPAYAKKIVANRPYRSVNDLSKTGMPASTIDKISGKVTVAHQRSPAAAPSSRAPQPTTVEPSSRSRATNRTETAPAPRATAPRSTPSQDGANADHQGQVWLNTDTNIYHRQDSRWYGKTKSGKYVTEEEAIREGARAAENE
jgi:DNA uptake protein ComE-like DNA-binding protein